MSAPVREQARLDGAGTPERERGGQPGTSGEDKVKLAILAVIILASLGASFSHMHDWTMRLMPAGTPDWFGWVNAVISELVPLVGTLSLRKRLRGGQKVWSYALVILLGGVLLSLAAQLSAVASEAPLSAKFLACLPALAALGLSKLVLGDLDTNRKQAEAEAGRAEQAETERAEWAARVQAARAETATVREQLAEAQARTEAETAEISGELSEARALAEAETVARTEAETRAELAETRAAEAETRIAEAETRAAAEAETRAEIEAATRAEIGRFEAAVAAADRRADEQAQLARIVEGQLAEARETADRAMVARVAAEQAAAEQVERVTAAAEELQARLRARVEQATAAQDDAKTQVTLLGEQVRTLQAQLTEAREYGERQATSRVWTEQQITELQGERDAALGELERVREAAANEIEKLRRQVARAAERAEIGSGRQAEISRAAGRKSLAAVPAGLAGNLPVVDTVSPETVATVLVAWAETPNATQAELHQRTGISDRTIRKVLKAIPAEIADEVLELTDGRAA